MRNKIQIEKEKKIAKVIGRGKIINVNRIDDIVDINRLKVKNSSIIVDGIININPIINGIDADINRLKIKNSSIIVDGIINIIQADNIVDVVRLSDDNIKLMLNGTSGFTINNFSSTFGSKVTNINKSGLTNNNFSSINNIGYFYELSGLYTYSLTKTIPERRWI